MSAEDTGSYLSVFFNRAPITFQDKSGFTAASSKTMSLTKRKTTMQKHLADISWSQRFSQSFPCDPDARNTIRQVLGALYSKTQPTPVKNPQLLLWSDDLAQKLGLARPDPSSPSLQILGGNHIPQGMLPFATRYGGHQFGHWAGQLGDGRAISLGEVAAPCSGTLWELQLKGAGPTPYSRHADGRAVLRSSVREYLASEALFALGVPTTRALSLVLTGEKVLRDMFYDGHPEWEPGAIVCRVSQSFLRFGHFEILRSCDEIPLMATLLDFVVRHFYPTLDPHDPKVAAEFFKDLCQRTARLAAHWMRIGFVHGVLNTDNMSLLGETIDYGPFGFLDGFDPHWTPNTTDFEGRRYCFGKQPSVCKWNLARLGAALDPLIPDADAERLLAEGLDLFDTVFQREFYGTYARKLGLDQLPAHEQQNMIMGVWRLLSSSEVDMTLFFGRMESWWRLFISQPQTDLEAPITSSMLEAIVADLPTLSYRNGLLRPDDDGPEGWKNWLGGLLHGWSLRLCRQRHDQEIDHEGRLFQRENPQIVPRNYMLQEAIDGVMAGNLDLLTRLERLLRRPYEPCAEFDPFQKKRPSWAETRPGCAMLSCSS